MRGCFLDAGSVGAGLDWSALAATLDGWVWHPNTAATDAGARLAGVDIAVTNKTVLDAAAIAAADRLRLICVAATGVNNVDLTAAAARGIPVVNVAGYAGAAVAQHVLALILARATRWADYAAAVAAGAWAQSEFFCRLDYPIVELAGRTLGLVGHGDIGARVEKLARALGMRVLVAERPGVATPRDHRVAFDTVLATADIISLHCPLTADTRDLIDAAALARMPAGAFLINTARAGLVDARALIAALRQGRIGGAALDVLDQEPPPPDHPLLDTSIPNLIVTPHSAWGSHSARQRLLDGLADNIRAFQRGETPNRVN